VIAFTLSLLLACSLFSWRVPAVEAQIAQAQTQSRQLQQTRPITQWPSQSKRWALIIGVDKYHDRQISRLSGADNDAKSLQNALVQYAGFPEDQIILLATDQPEERQPTRINILTYLSNIGAQVPKDGLLLISFAGHGIDREGQAYLIPSDARLNDDVSLLEESAISVSRMKDRIKSIGVNQVVVLLDACRNDPGGRADAPNNLTPAYTRAFNFDVRNREVQAFVTFYATAIGQRAYEYTEKEQGYFTWALIEGLKGGAANDRGEVTLLSLIRYVQEVVPKRVAINLGPGKQQRPFYQMDGYKPEQLVISVVAPSTTSQANTSATSGSVETDTSQVSPNVASGVRGDKLKDDALSSGTSSFETGVPNASGSASSGETINPTAEKYIEEGNRYLGDTKWLESERAYREAIKLSPTNARYHDLLGYVLVKQDKYIEAQSEFKEAVRLAPDNPIFKYDLEHSTEKTNR
jgi:hypothetical protein